MTRGPCLASLLLHCLVLVGATHLYPATATRPSAPEPKMVVPVTLRPVHAEKAARPLLRPRLVDLAVRPAQASFRPQLAASEPRLLPGVAPAPFPTLFIDLPQPPSASALFTPSKSRAAEAMPTLITKTKPVLLSRIQPMYPHRCRRRGHEGVAQFALTIDEKGRVIEAVITTRTGCPRLDAAARKTAVELRYEAASDTAQPRTRATEVRIRFELIQ